MSEPLETVRMGLQQFAAAAELEEKLDVKARGNMDDSDAVAVAAQATDAYMASCATLMGVMGKFKRDGRAHSLLAKNIGFMMERIEGLQVLLKWKGSASKRISYTVEELAKQRERARITQPTESDEKKRTLVAKEILSTESSYVRALESLQQHYIIPLTTGPSPVLDSMEKSSVFGNLDEILGFAQNFQRALTLKLDRWGPEQTLGDTFKQFAMFFKIYVIYTNSHQDGQKRARELLQTNEDAKVIASNAMANGCQDIGSLMITPIQRLPRYVLLLRELRKRTPDAHPDARLLESALADIQVVADHVNETLRRHESAAKLLEIQSALWTTHLGGVPVNLLEAGRQFIQQGTMYKVRRIGTLREVHLFLFSDILLYATSSKFLPGRFHYHNHLEFYGASPGVDEARALGASHRNIEFAFKVTSSQAVRVFIPSSQQERDEWMSIINDCARKKQDLDKRRSRTRMNPIQMF